LNEPGTLETRAPDRRGMSGRAFYGLPVCVALSLSWASSSVMGRESDVSGDGDGHLSTRSTVGDILRHPSCAGFGRRILPWDDRAYDENMRLTRIGSLLPYHSHVDPETVVRGLNRLIDDADSGRTVFYRFYTEAQRQEQPGRDHTGLFFFRGRPGAPFAVICPGGGFSYVGSVHEGFPHAAQISSEGNNAFVLKYRAGQGGTVATRDLAAAVSYLFRNAERLGVSTDGYSLWAARREPGWPPPSAHTGW
jgi:hypothetical protein